jgi:deoxyribonuclease-1
LKIVNLLCSLFVLVLSFEASALTKDESQKLLRLSKNQLKGELKRIISDNHNSIGYDRARDVIFEKIDNHNGEVCCVYSEEKCLKTTRLPSHKMMNIEHTWPQSLGARGTAKSDLHHLFPTKSDVNSTRSNFPFCEVVSAKWSGGGSKMGKDEHGTTCFEPPDEHKGNVARAMFYFSIRYNYPIDEAQEEVLRKWHHESPVDSEELLRHDEIVKVQKNINIFVVNPELVDAVADF